MADLLVLIGGEGVVQPHFRPYWTDHIFVVLLCNIVQLKNTLISWRF